MSFDNKEHKFSFVKQRNKFFLISAVLIVAGLVVLFISGLNLGIDFTSGTRVEVESDHSISVDKLENQFDEMGLHPVEVIPAGDKNQIGSARFDRQLKKQEVAKVKTKFKKLYGSDPNVSTVSPQVGRTLAKNALFALGVASIGIIIYVTIRFEFLQGLAAIVALLHDSFFIIAVFSLTRLEVNVVFVAAVLTIIGYSINDTIVVFDRIRENMRLAKRVRNFSELAPIVNRSIYQTLTRSINTVLTTILAALSILIFGGEAIRGFAFALSVGLVAGTYSSIFIAAQLWAVWKGQALKRKRLKLKENQA